MYCAQFAILAQVSYRFQRGSKLEKSRRWLWIHVLILVALCGWLAVQWPHKSLWYDEGLTAWIASGPWQRLFEWCTQVDIQVPLHYIVLKLWIGIAGSSEYALHLLSAFCGVLAVAGVIALARRLVGHRVATIAALLLGFSAGFLWVAYEVRAYALALALYAWASVFLTEILENKPEKKYSRFALIGYCGLMIALLYTHYTALGGLAAHVIIAAWTVYSRRSMKLARQLILVGAIIAAGFAPWLPILLARGTTDRSYYPGKLLPIPALGTIFSFQWLARDDNPAALAGLVWGSVALIIIATFIWLWLTRQARPVIYGLAIAL